MMADSELDSHLDRGGDSNIEDADGDLSDADSDYLELQADIARLDASRRAFLTEHLGQGYKLQEDASRTNTAAGTSAAARRRRGPRKAAEPSGAVKLQLQQAHQLFMDHRYDESLEALHEIIRVNAETHAAWSLLASINEDLGRRDEAIMAKVFAAHLEPKNVVGWLSTADYALAEAGDEGDGGVVDDEIVDEERRNRRLQNLQIARLCYSGAIRADKDNIAARLGKANVCLEFGQATNAATEYVRVLKRRPFALQVIRNLAEASYDSVRGPETIQAAILAYRKVIGYLKSRSYQSSPSRFEPFLALDEGEEFSWMDVTIYVELFAAISRFDEAIAVLKILARWMLGRGGPDEVYWNDRCNSDDDDCEWDRHNEPRRRLVPGFQPGRYPSSTYGEGLPIDLRAKLAIYRLRLGHEEEAIEHLSWIDPQDARTTESMQPYPHLLKEVGSELFGAGRFELALQYLELYRDLNRSAAAAELHGYDITSVDSSTATDEDAGALVLQGKCYLELHDHAAAEESFLAAIEADDENIDARFELAKMYEKAEEKEQAYILVNQALSLEAARNEKQQQQLHQHQKTGKLQLDPDHLPFTMSKDGVNSAQRKQQEAYGHISNMDAASFRMFLDKNGKVVRRRRKYRKRTEGGLATRKQRQRVSGGGVEATEREAGDTNWENIETADHSQAMLRMRSTMLRGRARRFFASPAEKAHFEATTSARLQARYQLCQDVKQRADGGDDDAAAQWMEAAKELIDDFRSFREFYTWDKYVQFLGYSNFLHDRGSSTACAGAAGGAGDRMQRPAVSGQHSSGLTELAERLQQKLIPGEADGGPRQYLQQQTDFVAAIIPESASTLVPESRALSDFAPTMVPELSSLHIPVRRDYRGIRIDDWLALFLEYALRLAHTGHANEAYAVCQSAHDSTVYRQHDNMFLIHLTWAACAVRAGDEQSCVAVGRYFMRDRPFTTDCYRLFSVMCRLCRAPSLWFGASPAQKYILRQIRQRDEEIQNEDGDDAHANSNGNSGLTTSKPKLDVCLLVVYGHILFASASFQFALNYYQRALALDPENPVISLCIGLSYVHWALKRQAENRQYLLTQGLNFLYRYAEGRLAEVESSPDSSDHDGNRPHVSARREAYFNIARTYHLLGLHALAAEFYDKVLREGGGRYGTAEQSDPELCTEAAYNLRTYYLLANNHQAALSITRRYLVV